MKVKELTLEQIKNICNEHYPTCRKDGKRCPLYHKTISCDSIISVIRSALRHNHDSLEEEVEEFNSKEDEPIKYYVALQELVDKATPKKRVYVDTTPSISSHFICPVCRTKVSPISLYCDTCGQRLE